MKVRIALAVIAVLTAGAVVAQGGPGPGAGAGSGPGQQNCQGRHGGGPPAYDTAGEKTVTGRVAELLPQPCACGGLHLRLTTADGDLEVALGPSPYLAEIGAAFLPQDEIQVTGARPSNAAPADFLARSVRKGGATFELRDAEGKPRWAGAGKACPMHQNRGAANAG